MSTHRAAVEPESEDPLPQFPPRATLPPTLSPVIVSSNAAIALTRAVSRQVTDPSCCDYDKRTPLCASPELHP